METKFVAGHFPTQTPLNLLLFSPKYEDNFAEKRKLRSFHLTIRIALAGEEGSRTKSIESAQQTIEI